MKKIFSIIASAALVFVAASCTQVEKIKVDSGNSKAPVLGTYKVADNITADYTPAEFYLNGEKVNPQLVTNILAVVKIDEQDVNLSPVTKDDGSTLTLKATNLNVALKAAGHAEGETLALQLVVRAQLSATANTGYLDSEEKIDANWTITAAAPGADPYAGWEPSPWGVTGKIESAGLNWDKDIEMVTDGTWHVAKGVVLTTADEFKYRKDHDWAENFGGNFAALDEEFEVSQGGPNIKVTEDGTYDLFLNPDGSLAKIIVTGSNAPQDPYAGFEEVSAWGVTGKIESAGLNWDKDIEMVTDGTWHVAKNVVLTTADEFKYRKDHDWAENFGGTFVSVGAEFEVTQGGANIKVAEDGTYDLLLDPVAGKAIVVVSGEDPFSGGGESGSE